MKKRIISALLVVAMVLTMAPVGIVAEAETESLEPVTNGTVLASGSCGDDLTWVLTEDGTLTISGNGDTGNYYENNPWYAWRESITALVIEEGVTRIGEDAFFGCNKLTKVTVSETLTQIHYDAFVGCDRLTYTYYGNAKYWGTAENPYYMLVKTASQYVTSVDVHPDTKVIADNAFYNCYNMTDLSLPEGLSHISVSAFSYCTALTNITIPESVVWMGDSAFWQCTGLERVNADSLSAWLGITFGSSGNPLEFADGLYIDGEVVTELVIPEDVSEVGPYTFYGYSALTSVTIPDHVTVIGEGAFSNCENLANVSVGNSISAVSIIIKTHISIKKI